MKAISLWQPWATLIALEAKRIETRHWQAPAWLSGQRIAIHAAKRESELWLCGEDYFADALNCTADELPLGAIVCTAMLDRSVPMTFEGIAQLVRQCPAEHAFGNYAVGRYAWIFRDVVSMPEPVPFRGRQGIFDVPDEIVTGDVPTSAVGHG